MPIKPAQSLNKAKFNPFWVAILTKAKKNYYNSL